MGEVYKANDTNLKRHVPNVSYRRVHRSYRPRPTYICASRTKKEGL
jgi:hypothetical protein